MNTVWPCNREALQVSWHSPPDSAASLFSADNSIRPQRSGTQMTALPFSPQPIVEKRHTASSNTMGSNDPVQLGSIGAPAWKSAADWCDETQISCSDRKQPRSSNGLSGCK